MKLLDKELNKDALMAEEHFDPSAWLSKQCAAKGVRVETTTETFERKKKFTEICQIVKNDLDKLVNKSEKEGNNEWLEKQHNAIIGDLSAMGYFINKIEEVLRTRNITSVDYPKYFNSLSEAIFHEVWGKGTLAKWDNRFPDSEACVISGLELWIDENGSFVRQNEKFESEKQVDKIINAFKMRDSDLILNHQNPEGEIEREDGARITIVVPPRAKERYIIFRRFIVKKFTLDEQAERNTIPIEDIPIYRLISQTMCNTVFAGRVRSAKSTFMKTMIAERDPGLVIGSLEKHFELALKRDFPDRLIYELKASEGDVHKAMPRLLRMEHDFIVIGEIRSKEIEGVMEACERGERGMFTTYHLTHVKHVVRQLARHLLDEHLNRTPELEIERVADNLDLIITMGTDRDRKTKRVTSVSEVIWDYETKADKTVILIQYSKRDKKYYYSSNVSNHLFNLMAEENEEAAIKLVDLLKEREKVSPMKVLIDRGVVQ